MSKSLGNILDPIEIIKKYGTDQLRYYLIKEVSWAMMAQAMDNLKNCINNGYVSEIYAKSIFLH